jgi:hypothetical protein
VAHAPPLAEFVGRVITDALIDAVAAEGERGRLLLVATTDLDRQTTMIWNMGAIAREKSAAARQLFRNVLSAGAHPHRDGRRHVRGDARRRRTTVPFFVAPEVASIVPGLLSGIPGVNLYVVMNTQLGGLPDTVPARLAPILVRSSAAVLSYMSRKELQVAVALAHDHEMSFRQTEIPIDYPYGGPIDSGAAEMRALFAYGRRCAVEGRLWTTPTESLHRSQAAVERAVSRKGKLAAGEVGVRGGAGDAVERPLTAASQHRFLVQFRL